MKPELVLSNTTSFFIGGIPATFKNAKKYGFKYLEILPYRWTSPEQILKLEQKYGVQVAGIHMPVWWKKTFWGEFRDRFSLFEKALYLPWQFYLGDAAKSSGLAIADALAARKPYMLLHSNLLRDMGPEISHIAAKYHVVVENIPYDQRYSRHLWDPLEILKYFKNRNLPGGLVFDVGHFNQVIKALPEINLFETYRQFIPEVIHISYMSGGIHVLPNKKEQAELVELLKIHPPRYITIETNPWVSVKKAKKLMEEIIVKSGY